MVEAMGRTVAVRPKLLSSCFLQLAGIGATAPKPMPAGSQTQPVHAMHAADYGKAVIAVNQGPDATGFCCRANASSLQWQSRIGGPVMRLVPRCVPLHAACIGRGAALSRYSWRLIRRTPVLHAEISLCRRFRLPAG